MDYQKLGAAGHIASVAREESNESVSAWFYFYDFISTGSWLGSHDIFTVAGSSQISV